MKKTLPLVAVLVLVLVSCAAKHKADDKIKPVSVAYKAMTRGSQKDVLITDKNYTDTTVRRGEEVKGKGNVTPDQWNAIVAEASKLDYGRLNSINAPSVKHQFDGALAANVIITTADSTYQSVTFDHGNPPAELKPLLKAMAAVSGSINN
jgi:hypothetical protein